MDRKLIDYLPRILKDVREYKSIMVGEQPEIEDLWDALGAALDDQFIADATEYGIERYEGILSITPKAEDTIEDRRFRIQARFGEQLPYTFRTLKNRLIDLCGEDGFTLELFNTTYTLKVRIELVVKSQYDSVENLLDRLVPANLVIDLDLRYNLYVDLEGELYSHWEYATYDELRNEVLV
jgi:hypothetical protein